jgi:hypothetical protein
MCTCAVLRDVSFVNVKVLTEIGLKFRYSLYVTLYRVLVKVYEWTV